MSLAFISHSDVGRHDNGWNHPEHVGRIRAITRAMRYPPELFMSLEHVEGRHATVDELAQQAPLVRFEMLTLVRVGTLLALGFRLEPTGRNPKHFTVAFDDLDRGVEALEACEHRSWLNPYYED